MAVYFLQAVLELHEVSFMHAFLSVLQLLSLLQSAFVPHFSAVVEQFLVPQSLSKLRISHFQTRPAVKSHILIFKFASEINSNRPASECFYRSGLGEIVVHGFCFESVLG